MKLGIRSRGSVGLYENISRSCTRYHTGISTPTRYDTDGSTHTRYGTASSVSTAI